MSNRPSQYAEYPQHHAHDHGRPQARRVAPAKPPASHAKQSDYTIAHRGKQVRIGPVVFWIVVGTVTVLGAWSAATATYFAFRDDVLTKLIARQAEMQYAYEDRISELRAKIDRTTSRQMLDQEQFDQKLDQVMRRQSTLESRATALGAMPDLSITGSIPKAPARGAAIDTNTSIPKPSPISDTVTFVAPPDREARLESRTPALAVPPTNQFAKLGGVDNVIGRLQASLDQVESRQMAALGAAEESMDSKVRRMRGAISDLGLNMAKLESATPRAAMGGPYVPVKLSANADPFERQLYRIQIARAQMDKLNRTMALVPYRKPVVGEVEFTSGFGVRSDPFLGRPAMHTGLDFRAATGDPIRATANGKVSTAGWAGGYGQMVEVDHGNGLATRYGHMSKILVKVGDPIKIGQVIGLVGSTGRSTGSHLHYETRIDGEAVDPQKFLRAGVRLSAG
jgi:murein DD-endopeptidase MepM/ murein hydrolase activator NlpD